MAENRPNILLLMTDQHRGDCLGLAGHRFVQTPYLDHIGASGVFFRRAYSECPVCVPARRSLMTGRTPASQGTFMNYHTWLDGPTLPGVLSAAGYQSHLVGKLHFYPKRKLYGFDSADWSDSPRPEPGDDYQRFLQREGVHGPRLSEAHGCNQNGWSSRPWHMDERLHFTNWCASSAIEFLQRRDPTVPFFLNVSFLHPHQPLTPPQVYYDRYMAMDIPLPPVAEWAEVFDAPQLGLRVDSWRTWLTPQVMKQMMASYYACINHIDDQIGRLMTVVPHNTIVVFTSDHGEMLGDHQWIRKRSAYEGSARIPMLMRFPHELGLPQGQAIDRPIQLMDIMPTLLDAVGVEAPDRVEGQSLLGLIRGEQDSFREYVHGECAEVPSLNSGQQYLTDGRVKYIWYPGTGGEQLFDVENDPHEMRDLAGQADWAATLELWRGRLVEKLTGRPEGFTDGQKLLKLDGTTPFFAPGYDQATQNAKHGWA